MAGHGETTRRPLVQSVERALDILEMAGRSRLPLRNGEIARGLGVSAATANNLIRTLFRRGYLEQDADGRYTLGLRSFVLGTAADTWRDLRAKTLEPMRRFVRASGATCFLGIFHHFQVIAINVLEGTGPISISMRQMWLDQCHSTAAGKILLGGLSHTELAAFLGHNPLRRLTERTICDPEKLMAEIAAVQERGYAVARDESVFGISSTGVPVLDRDGRILAALSCSFSSYFLDEKYLSRQLALLRKTKQELEEILRS